MFCCQTRRKALSTVKQRPIDKALNTKRLLRYHPNPRSQLSRSPGPFPDGTSSSGTPASCSLPASLSPCPQAPPPDPSVLRAPRPLRLQNPPPRAPPRSLCPPPAPPETPSSHTPQHRPPVPSVPAVPVPGADMGPPGAAAASSFFSSASPRPPSASPLTAARPPLRCLTHGAAPTEPAAPAPPRPGAKGGGAPLHGGRAAAAGGAERLFPRGGGQAARRAAPRGALAADGLPGVRRRKGKRNGNENGNGRGKELSPASLTAAGKGEIGSECHFRGGPSARLGLWCRVTSLQ